MTGRLSVVCVLALWCCGEARAATGDWTLHGFGSLAAATHDVAGVQFRRDIGQGSGAMGNQWSFDPDTMLGLQLSGRFGERVEAMVQGVSRQTTDDSYAPDLSWAYLKLHANENLALRFGRMTSESYIRGDSAEIGYANLTVRPQVVFYPRVFDGADAEYIHPMETGFVRLKAQVGYTRGKLIQGAAPYDTSGSRSLGLGLEYQQGGWGWRLAYGRIRLKHESPDMLPSGRGGQVLALLPNAATISDSLFMQGRALTLKSAALTCDEGRWQAVLGYGRIDSANWAPMHNWYGSVGYRLGRWTPYAAYTSQRTQRTLLPSGIPGGLSPQTDMLNQAADLMQSARLVNQDDLGIGLRYDFARNYALKLQADLLRYQDPLSIVDPALLTVPVAARGYKRMKLFSVAFDFMF